MIYIKIYIKTIYPYSYTFIHMDDTSLTLIHTLDQGINSVDNNSDVNESQTN